MQNHKITGLVRSFAPPRLLVFGLVVMLCAMTLFGAYRTAAHPPPPRSQNKPVGDFTADVRTLGQQYMNALLHKQYALMWSLLHPQIQAQWPDEHAFAQYWQARFQGFALQHFTLGNVSDLASWVDAETMQSSAQVKMVPVSLHLVPQVAPDKLATLPTPDQHPDELFQNLPLVVQHVTTRDRRQRWLVLSGGPADPEAPILPPLTPQARTIDVPILMYHHISDVPPKNVLDQSLTVTSAVFGQQLDHLKAHNYHTITFNQLFGALYYNIPLPTKPIILTFDDGYDDAYTVAYPLLKAHGYSGMFYIITGKVGWQGQATWDQLREMRAQGMQIGAHTVTHADLNVLWNSSPTQAEYEIRQSRQALESQLGTPVQQFCYPSGEPFHHGSAATRQAILALLDKSGYVGATTDPPPLGTLQDSQHPFVLVRVRIDGRASLASYEQTFP